MFANSEISEINCSSPHWTKELKVYGSYCCETPETFIVRWIPKPCDFFFGKTGLYVEVFKDIFTRVFVEGGFFFSVFVFWRLAK